MTYFLGSLLAISLVALWVAIIMVNRLIFSDTYDSLGERVFFYALAIGADASLVGMTSLMAFTVPVIMGTGR